jgi:hypothetical protein
MKYNVKVSLFIAGLVVVTSLFILIDAAINPCRFYNPDAKLIAKIDGMLHKDPRLSSLLGNNSYVIHVLNVVTYPYIENG